MLDNAKMPSLKDKHLAQQEALGETKSPSKEPQRSKIKRNIKEKSKKK